MARFIYFLLLGVLLMQTNCSSRKAGLTGLWFYASRIDLDVPHDSSVTATSFVDLHGDGTYTRDCGHFDYGHWQQKDSILILKPRKSRAVNLSITDIMDEELELQVNEKVVVRFARMPGNFSDSIDNPFSVENNMWRIKPGRKESDVELRIRLKNHVDFFYKYFRWGIADGLPTIDVRSTPSLIKIYRNGFALRPFEDLPAAWKSYFYDEEDCRKANDMMKIIFDKNEIAWTDTDNRYKMFSHAFLQLSGFLK